MGRNPHENTGNQGVLSHAHKRGDGGVSMWVAGGGSPRAAGKTDILPFDNACLPGGGIAKDQHLQHDVRGGGLSSGHRSGWVALGPMATAVAAAPALVATAARIANLLHTRPTVLMIGGASGCGCCPLAHGALSLLPAPVRVLHEVVPVAAADAGHQKAV